MKHPVLTSAALAALMVLVGCSHAPTAGPSASASAKPRVEKAADLPRFSYTFDRPLVEVVRSPQAFAPFAAKAAADLQQVLDGHDIPDRATRAGLIGQLATLELLAGRHERALQLADDLRALQDKPADTLLAGLRLRAMATAARSHPVGSPAWAQASADFVARAIDAMPYATIENDIKSGKAGLDLLGEGRVIGSLAERLQPIVDQSGRLGSDFSPGLINARMSLVATLPARDALVQVYSRYLDRHQVAKADIWAARDVTLAAGSALTPVRIAVWDSGVDTQLFGDKTLRGGDGQPRVIGFDKYAQPSNTELAPLPADVKARLPKLIATTKGFSDLQSNIDSAEGRAVKGMLANLKPAEFKPVIEELRLIGNYEHGTHVAGIALAGNPAARLVVGRIEFGHTLRPDPCPSMELAQKDARAAQQVVDFFRREGVRVVNMSWGGSVNAVEAELQECNLGRDAEGRKRLARELFEVQRNALTKAFASAPEILFITAAGNSSSDASFVEDIPASIRLPNLLTVGAVDLAGDEAPFTSYGPTVRLHANGYQVPSLLPGGATVALSGTSMAAPQAANLAGKLLAVKPSLTPTEVIDLMVRTADRSADGRRVLMDPKKALGQLGL